MRSLLPIALLFCLFLETPSGQRQIKFGTLSDFVLIDNGLYMGDFRAGLPNGQGTVVFFTDDPLRRYNYTGGWRRGRREGEGRTVFRDGRVYQGEYGADRESGRGTVTWPNGDRFEGFYKAGRREGSGRLVFAVGGRREGEWKEDRLEGFVFFHWNATSGAQIERWERGRRIGDGAKERDRVPGETHVEDNTVDIFRLSDGTSPGNFTRGGGGGEFNMTYFLEREEEERGKEGGLLAAAAEMSRREARQLLKAIFDSVQ